MATIDRTVAAMEDNAEEADNNTQFKYNSIYVTMTADSNANARFNGGFRFTNITIPQGATILDGCYFGGYIWSVNNDDINTTVYGEDTNSALNFSAEPDVTQRLNTKKTSANTTWYSLAAGTGYKYTPEIKDIIQEIVDRPGWLSGNSLCILVKASGAGPHHPFSVFNWKFNSPRQPAVLHIEYSPVATPTNLQCHVLSSDTIRLTWNDNSNNEEGFKIERAPVSGGPWDQIATVGANVEEYTDGGLDPNTQYCYRIRAYKSL